MADDVSRWDGDARSAVRLIAGSPPAGNNAAMLRVFQRGEHQLEIDMSGGVQEITMLF